MPENRVGTFLAVPMKYQIMIAIFWILGVGIGSWLFSRIFGAKRRGIVGALWPAAQFLLFLAVVTVFAYVFVPSFNPFRPLLSRVAGREKVLVLTFDDGPNEPFTSEILDLLKGRGLKATFFLLGKNAERYPEVVKRIVEEGHQIGNHTYSHRPLITLDETQIAGEIEGWEKVMAPLGIHTNLFRAPHGWKVPWLYSVLDRKNYQLIAWTRGVWDTDQPGEEILFQRLTEHLASGEIILLHDGIETRIEPDRSQLLKVLPRVLDYYRDQGYEIIPLSQVKNGISGEI
ncbi:MAG: polysaccharide deacetylase family protein [Deltaproteobacteria bacterium]|nr:polysaccharide deacetylase family protein [Deltaproteobacteria bacterium]